MSRRINKRKLLFNKFSKQLHLLKNEGLINFNLKYENTYICPICLTQFQESDLNSSKGKNYLTEEDSPPAKLNGSRIALTCKQCNSKTGHQIDSHLIHGIRNLDDKYYLNSESQKRKIIFEGSSVSGYLTPKGDGLIEVHNKIENNDPKLLDKLIYSMKNGSIMPALKIAPRYKDVKGDRVNRALLKTTYMLTFSKFGYIFLLDEYYDSIRKQILDLNYKFGTNIFVKNQFNRDQIGTHYINNLSVRALLNIFSLKTKYSETLIGSIFPMLAKSPESIHKILERQGYEIGQKGKFGLSLDTSFYDPDADLFADINKILEIYRWINFF